MLIGSHEWKSAQLGISFHIYKQNKINAVNSTLHTLNVKLKYTMKLGVTGGINHNALVLYSIPQQINKAIRTQDIGEDIINIPWRILKWQASTIDDEGEFTFRMSDK